MERETGFEPATPTLARLCSTTELFPQPAAGLQSRIVTKALWGVNLRAIRNLASEVLGGFFWRGWVDEEARAPLETRDARELRDDLEVPVEVIERRSPERRAVQHEVVRGIAEVLGHGGQDCGEQVGQRRELLDRRSLEARSVGNREDPRLEGKPRGEGGDGHEALGLADDPELVTALLAHD